MRIFIACIVMLTLSAHAGDAPRGDEGNPAYMWDLRDLYPDDATWKAEFDKIHGAMASLGKLKGTLGGSAAQLLSALDAISKVRKEGDRLFDYASLKGDENLQIPVNQERVQLAQNLLTALGRETAWLTPGILSLDESQIKAFLNQSPELAHRFGFFIDNALRSRSHTLGTEAEGAMAAATTFLAQPNNIYSQLSMVELPFPTVTLSDGTQVKLDEPAYEKYRQLANRADRKLVFDEFWGAWKKYEGTFGATLTAQVMGAEFDAGQRHFPSALADAVFADNMPESVFRQLVTQANAGLPTLYRYFKLRQRLLGITDELAYYDVYPSMFKRDQTPRFNVAESERIALAVTAPYGPEYAALLRKGFAGRWMDVLPRESKATGAYMNGYAYDVHPYLHLNHNYDYQSLSTFVHEWGHGVHTLLADANQPYEKSNYSSFTAETASIANEMLLYTYMTKQARSTAEKLIYLGEGLDLIRGTFFRQAMFGEFQLAIHEEVEKGNALSGKRITEIYCGLVKKYHGEAAGVMKIDPAYCIEWAFIPHFYMGFYIYQYATSIAGAALFTHAIEKEGKPARDRYIDMLKAGNSDYAYALYKKAGLDMASPAPYQALVARMDQIMDEMDALLRQSH